MDQNINAKLNIINEQLNQINDLLLRDNKKINREEILKKLSLTYINLKKCANNLKYLKMKECNHIFIKRRMMTGDVNYCICCGLNNYYEHLEQIENTEDKVLQNIYENTKNNGEFLFENIIYYDIENIQKLYNQYKMLPRQELLNNLRENNKKLIKNILNK